MAGYRAPVVGANSGSLVSGDDLGPLVGGTRSLGSRGSWGPEAAHLLLGEAVSPPR